MCVCPMCAGSRSGPGGRTRGDRLGGVPPPNGRWQLEVKSPTTVSVHKRLQRAPVVMDTAARDELQVTSRWKRVRGKAGPASGMDCT
jgi:hypothetical protein